jgi:hypothetical protein
MTTTAILAVTIPTGENSECEMGRPKPPQVQGGRRRDNADCLQRYPICT